ncbi:MAG: polymorphic toxin type 15 domain-containing protein [Pseudomonadota bacterium]
MSFDVDDMGHVWSNLRSKEDELKWGGNRFGGGPQYDSMGRPASSSSYFNAGWRFEQMGRVERVRKALDDSGPMAERMIAQTLSDINLSSIWHILISACQDIALYYGGSVAAGGVIGSFFGGVGAIPGAAAGGVVGGWALSFVGLTSLVEGLTQAIPESFHYYEKGFLEAWGPIRQDPRNAFGSNSRGDPGSAAFLLANGHVVMISALLAVMVAYLTHGKGDKAARLNEIRQSPRLGPRMARWVADNEEKLSRRFARRKQGSGILPPEEPRPPKRKQKPEEDRKPNSPNEMPQKKVPCFTIKGLPQGSVPEFDRQLSGQETGINNMTVDEYIKGREAFKAGDSVRDPKLAKNARAGYQVTLTADALEELRVQGMSYSDAKTKAAEMAAEKMKTLAALHNPDMVAAGKDVISDFGDRNINSRIGAQWNKGKRLLELDRAASDIPESICGSTKMKAKLERCK